MDKIPTVQKNAWGLKRGFILASGSPARLKLLKNAGFIPEKIVPADINEDILDNERPAFYVRRMAFEKASFVASRHPEKVILSADTVIAVGHRVIRKAGNEQEAHDHLDLISGRGHKVITAFCIIAPNKKPIVRSVTTRVLIKPLSSLEKKVLLTSDEWRNVAGYSIEGMLSAVVKKIVGSYPNIVGLPIYEVSKDLLRILS